MPYIYFPTNFTCTYTPGTTFISKSLACCTCTGLYSIYVLLLYIYDTLHPNVINLWKYNRKTYIYAVLQGIGKVIILSSSLHGGIRLDPPTQTCLIHPSLFSENMFNCGNLSNCLISYNLSNCLICLFFAINSCLE